MIQNKPVYLSATCITLICLILLSTRNVSARIEYRTVDAEGRGVSLQRAVERALIVGINKVNGSIISSRANNLLSQKAFSKNNKKITQTKKFFEESISKRTQGIVKSYEIISRKKDTRSKLYRVLLRVTVPVFKHNSQLRRIKLSLVPLRILEKTTPKSHIQNFERVFRLNLENYITQSRKFAVLDRIFLDEQDSELDFLKRDGTNADELARLGNRLGADYIITGLVERARYKLSKTAIKTTGQLIKTTKTSAKITIRIIDIVSTQIKFSATEQLSHKDGSMETLARKFAEIFGRKIVDAIFPISVLDVSGNIVTLGQGGDTVKIGTQYNLVALGRKLIDPYTGESLGRKEETVGMIKIIGSQSKVSTGEIVDLKIARSDILKSDLIARQQQQNYRKRIIKKKFSDIEKMIDLDFQTD
ncbi:MAG: hypothetical protein CMM44_03380 [Rhodospirillaceae bacterium]|nr:hypothetical protein [Rhodospirillaceae bacterium]|tara:strand:- start:15369 stop:16622 length:1254 start_codon:yes stop_codon:yes gene_type:complete